MKTILPAVKIIPLAFAAVLVAGAAFADEKKCWTAHVAHPCTQAELDAHEAKIREIYDKIVSGECPLVAGTTPEGEASFIVNFWQVLHDTPEAQADCKNP